MSSPEVNMGYRGRKCPGCGDMDILMFKVELCTSCLHEKDKGEIKRLRRSLDSIKVRAYELGQKELHDMALKTLEVKR